MHREVLTIAEAAAWLRIVPGTLHNWITYGRFTTSDGLMRLGGSTRVHFPTMRARAMAGDLLLPSKSNGTKRRGADE
jgi:hypothetical protein